MHRCAALEQFIETAPPFVCPRPGQHSWATLGWLRTVEDAELVAWVALQRFRYAHGLLPPKQQEALKVRPLGSGVVVAGAFHKATHQASVTTRHIKHCGALVTSKL